MSTTKILMVCLGNICRSPLAEGILRSKLPLESFSIDSAGTSNFHIGEQPDNRSIVVAKTNGIDITEQRGRQFVISDFDNFDYIFAMDESNYQNILKLSRNKDDSSKVSLILNELENIVSSNVPDPYYGGALGFEKVFRLLNQACDSMANRLIT